MIATYTQRGDPGRRDAERAPRAARVVRRGCRPSAARPSPLPSRSVRTFWNSVAPADGPERPHADARGRHREAVARRQGARRPARERAADRRPRGLGRRVRRHRRHGRAARHRRRRQPPRPLHPDRRHPELRPGRGRSPTSTATAPTSPPRSSAPAPPRTATTRASPRGRTSTSARCSTTTGHGQDSWVMAGMEWAAQSGAKVVNMSLGDSGSPSDGTDPMSQAVDALSAQYGTLFVIAAGNAGPQTHLLPRRGRLRADRRGRRQAGRPRVVLQHRPAGPVRRHQAGPRRARRRHHRGALAGDDRRRDRPLPAPSAAPRWPRPHVAGSAAILAQQHPGWTGAAAQGAADEQREGAGRRLLAVRGRHRPRRRGGGRRTTRCAAPARSSSATTCGRTARARSPVTNDLTFTNDGDPGRHPRPGAERDAAAPFTLGDSTVTVPAGGKATVPVTGDPQAAAIGRDVGWIVGTDEATGTPVTRTSVGLLKEDERYDLNISLVDRRRQPRRRLGRDQPGRRRPGPVGRVRRRLEDPAHAPGRLLGRRRTSTSGRAGRTGPAWPCWSTRRSCSTSTTDVVLDARNARLLQTTAPQRTEDRQRKVDLEHRRRHDGHGVPQRVRGLPRSTTTSTCRRPTPMTRRARSC